MNKNIIKGKNRTDAYLSIYEEVKDLPKKAQARVLFSKFPKLFDDVEIARKFVRASTGSMGERKQVVGAVGVVDTYKSTIKDGLEKLRIYEESKLVPYKINGSKVVILNDIHLPYHDEESLRVALEYAVSYNPDTIVLNGDILDCYESSSFVREINKPSLFDEINSGRDFFAMMRDLFPNAEIIYKLGNHEERLRRFILKNAAMLAAFDELNFDHLLGLDKLNVKLINKEIIKAGKLNILHGHELGESVFSPVNPARGMFLKAKCSTIFGHNHQISHHSESTLNGDQTGVWSIGCLCHLTPEYRPYAYTKWRHGFATVDIMPNGNFKVDNKEIINGEIV